jgi:DNA-binding NtrC family response regulator
MSIGSSHPQAKQVLVVDDHAAARESVADVLRHAGYEVTSLGSPVEALACLEQHAFDLVITDLQMPGMDGLEFIREIRRRRFSSQILMVTAHATISSAVEAMRQGAFDYLEKPFDVVRLEQLVARAIDRGSLMAPDVATGKSDSALAEDLIGMVGDSPAMSRLRDRIRQVAPTDETVLICGESGTGKELVAQAIHGLSRRTAGELVSLNCPALSPQLTESELFGHCRGAFTGAEHDRVGRFEQAQGGTILLDEITEIDLGLQSKLLRVLQERTFERVGSSQSVAADVRVLASTNRDLPAEIAAGNFRQDLYYRLAVVPVALPALRERGDDVQQLADFFLDRAARRLQRPKCAIEESTRQLFAQYHWPGNVRELENIITRACVLNDGSAISASELRPWLEDPEAVGSPTAAALPVGTSLEEMERQMIVATLEHYDGHRARTAEALGIGVRTLSGKLRSYGYAPREKSFSPAPQRQNLPLAAISAGLGNKKVA